MKDCVLYRKGVKANGYVKFWQVVLKGALGQDDNRDTLWCGK